MQSDNDIEMQRKAFEAAWQQVTGLEAPPLRSPNNSDCYYYSTTEKMWALWQAAVLRERERLVQDAILGRVAMRFVDRAGDPALGIDEADRICLEFHEAMTAARKEHP